MRRRKNINVGEEREKKKTDKGFRKKETREKGRLDYENKNEKKKMRDE